MTMVERVSRALDPEAWASIDTIRELDPDYYSSLTETERRARLLAKGQTAIEAMRGPTEDMVEIAGDIEGYADRDRIFEHAWNAMIDGALFEEKAAAQGREKTAGGLKS